MERYEIYAPIPELRGRLSHGHIQEGEDGVTVLLFVESEKKPITVSFIRVASYRRTMEECSFGSFQGEWEDPVGQMPSFTVRNSAWVASFSAAELIHYPNPTHYVFLTGWQQIEILACEAPTICRQ
jgi:hypothetical protein